MQRFSAALARGRHAEQFGTAPAQNAKREQLSTVAAQGKHAEQRRLNQCEGSKGRSEGIQVWTRRVFASPKLRCSRGQALRPFFQPKTHKLAQAKSQALLAARRRPQRHEKKYRDRSMRLLEGHFLPELTAQGSPAPADARPPNSFVIALSHPAPVNKFLGPHITERRRCAKQRGRNRKRQRSLMPCTDFGTSHAGASLPENNGGPVRWAPGGQPCRRRRFRGKIVPMHKKKQEFT